MLDYLKKVLKLVKPYRFRFGLGVFCGFMSGMLAFTLPLSLKLALDTVFPTEKAAAAFAATDVKDPLWLARELTLKTNELSAFLSTKLDAAAHQALSQYQNTNVIPEQLQAALLADLNLALVGQTIYEEGRFRNVTLRPETRKLLRQHPEGKDAARLNRLLLEDAYPKELVPRPLSGGTQKLQSLPPSVRRILDKIMTWFRPT